MLPLPWFNITRSSCFMLNNVPSTFVSNVAAKLSAVCSVTRPRKPSVPALLTAISRRPKRLTVWSTRLRTSSSLRTSLRTKMASAPSACSSATNSFPSRSRRPDTTTCAPSCAKITAAARPIPVSAPVIKTTGELMALPPFDLDPCRLSMTEISAKPLWDSSDHCVRLRISLLVAPLRHTLLSWEQCFTSMGVGMELRHLRYFIAVAEAGSLTVAAEQILHTSQPSLSRQIRDLEEEVGARLLTRRARGIELTPAGRAFLD